MNNDVKKIQVQKDRLKGLPEDWIAAHPADEQGLVTITTSSPGMMFQIIIVFMVQ